MEPLWSSSNKFMLPFPKMYKAISCFNEFRGERRTPINIRNVKFISEAYAIANFTDQTIVKNHVTPSLTGFE